MKLIGFLVLVSFSGTFGARILGVVTTPSFSHQEVFQPLWKELSLRGHQVTVLTTNPVNDSKLTNLTEIDLSSVYKMFKDSQSSGRQNYDLGPFGLLFVVHNYFKLIVRHELQNEQVQALIRSPKTQFDVVLVEAVAPAMYYFAERFKCPFIGLRSLESDAVGYRAMGNPTSPALYPDILLPFSEELSFWQRVVSLSYEIAVETVNIWLRYPSDYKLASEFFGEGLPSIPEMRRKMNMMFTNTNPILQVVRPLLPNIIQIGGGIHFRPSKPLPNDLKQRLDLTSANNGFIYFSLGSNVRSEQISIETRKLLIQVFSELPYLVLWKFELDDLPDKPSNVIISKWFPQQDLLRHPKIRLFITQGGLQSAEEAIYSGVPLLIFPYIGDQARNADTFVRRGLGLTLNIQNVGAVNAYDIKTAIDEVINNPKYRENVRKIADLSLDEPMSGLEKAVWWTEYIIRNKGAEHLRRSTLDLPWYQYYLLDVILFLLTIIIIVAVILVKIIRLFVRVTLWVIKDGSKKTKNVNKSKKSN